jgi:predicted nucleic acid-binding protein
MLVYLDTMILVYRVEGDPVFRTRARTHLANLAAAGDQFAVSALSRLECRMKPLRMADTALLGEYDRFFADPSLVRLSLPDPVFERATLIQAQERFRLADSLHLAAAIEGGCQRFLTNDLQLVRFTGITVEILP